MPDKNEKSFKESEEELKDELAKQRKQRKLEEINDKIMKHGIIEKLNIREIEPEILDETKVYGKIKTRLRKLKTIIIKKKTFWKKNDEQERLERLERKIDTEKLESVKKIKAYEIRIGSVKDEAKKKKRRADDRKNK